MWQNENKKHAFCDFCEKKFGLSAQTLYLCTVKTTKRTNLNIKAK